VRIKRFPVGTENELFKKLHPVLLHIFSKGILESSSLRLCGASIGSLALVPMDLVLTILTRSIDLLIILAVWWFLKNEFSTYPSLLTIGLTLSLVAVFYKDIHDEIISILIDFVIILTGGGFLRWVCKGYLTGTGFRQRSLIGKHMEQVVGRMAPVLPSHYCRQYDELFNLYFESNEEGKEEELIRCIEGYWEAA